MGAQVVIGGQKYPIQDVSIGGFRISPYDGDLVERQEFDLVFRLIIDYCVTECRSRGLVYRIDQHGLVALFTTDQPAFYQKLCQFIERSRTLSISYHADPSGKVPKPAFVQQTV